MFLEIKNNRAIKRVIRYIPVLPFFLATFLISFSPLSAIPNSNQDFVAFKKAHDFRNLYVVFAGPYPSSPSSSFGHIFLLLEPKEISTPMLLWDAVNFSADADTLGTFATFFKGIFGGLIGNYNFIPFHEKLREYTFIESRPLWIFPFEMSFEESEKFLRYLYKMQKINFDYRFMDKNCASQIESLLQMTIGDSANINTQLTSPRDVLVKNPKLNARLKQPLFIGSTESVIDDFLSKQPGKILENLKNPKLVYKDIPPAEAAILLSILEWKYFRRKILLSEIERKQLQYLRLAASQPKKNNQENFKKTITPFYMHPPKKMGIGLRYSNKSPMEYELIFRPGLHDFHDNDDSYPKYDFISLAEINISFSKKRFYLNELWLFNQKSIKPHSQLSSYISWKLAVGTERKFGLEETPVASGIFSGLGTTFTIKKDLSTISFFWNLDPVYLENMGYSILSGPELISTITFSNNLKILSSLSSEMNIFKNGRVNHFFESSLSFKLTSGSRLLLKTGYSENGFYVGTQLHKYID